MASIGLPCNALSQETLSSASYSIDGWFNHPEFPSAGSVGASITRHAPQLHAEFEIPDIINMTSSLYYQNSTVSTRIDDSLARSSFFVFFAQFVFMDIINVKVPACPREYLMLSSNGSSKVGVADGHHGKWLPRSDRSGRLLSSCKAHWDWRTSMAELSRNWVTGYLDGNSIYGTSGQMLQSLRAFKLGKVGRYDSQGFCHIDLRKIYDDNSSDFPRTRYIMAIHEMWLHWHNLIADKLFAEAEVKNISLDDDTLFQEARRWTIATYQSVVENELLPLLFNDTNFKINVQVTPAVSVIDSFFAAASSLIAFMTPETVLHFSDGANCVLSSSNETKRFCELLSDDSYSLDLLLDMASSPAKAFDFAAVEDLSRVPYKNEETVDFLALIIARSRDLSLPSYSQLKNFLAFENEERPTWNDLQIECGINEMCKGYVDKLREIYRQADHVELIPGGLINFQKFFGEIFREQFRILRQSDMLWYSSAKTKQFSSSQINCLKRASLSRIISSVYNSSSLPLQRSVLLLQDNPCWKKRQSQYSGISLSSASSCPMMVAPTPEVTVPVALTLTGIVIFVLLVVSCLYWPQIQRYSRERIEIFKAKKPGISRTSDGKFFAKEYLGSKKMLHKWRRVIVEISLRDRVIRLLDPLDQKKVLRKIIFFNARQNLRPTTSHAARRASSIIHQSESLREAIARRRLTPKAAPQRNYILTETLGLISLRVPADAHLALKFSSEGAKNAFVDALTEFTADLEIEIIRTQSSKQHLLSSCITKAQHKRRIEHLLSAALLEASDSKKRIAGTFLTSAAFGGDDSAIPFEEILHLCQITLPELASLLRTDPSDKFTSSLFDFMDKDRTGAIAYRDLVDFMALIANGNDRDRINILFQLYDTNCDGYLSFEEFATMLASLSAVGNQQIPDSVLQKLFEEIIQNTIDVSERDNEEEAVSRMSFDDLWRVFEMHKSDLNLAAMTFPGILPDEWSAKQQQDGKDKIGRTASIDPTTSRKPPNSVAKAFGELEPPMEEQQRDRSASIIPSDEDEKEGSAGLTLVRSFFDSYSLELFWGTLYVCICAGLFVMRFMDSYFNQTAVIAVVGLGAPFARAGAMVINFTFATLILMMARNVFTAIRETKLRYYFPFDSVVEAHKFISIINLAATVLHTFAHISNFYYLSQLPLEDLWCLMPELKGVHPPPGRNIFIWLGYETLTGLTGFLLIAVYVPIFAFAFGRSFAFRQFWITHQLWPVAATLLGLHGLGCLLQTPLFYAFFLGPACIFLIDRVLSTMRRTSDLELISIAALPSNVTHLVFEKPQDVEYVAGQWVRIRVPECGQEYHPFTLTSAPHESNMSLHILSVGPWTRKLNKLATGAIPKPISFVQIEGPYGEGHQDWHRSDIAVLVGAGIGVTPFASILKHIAHLLTYSYMPYDCKKVYFFWITRNQKQFEWFTDIIRQVESVDTNNFVSTHICITQFQSKFDFRTIMLYICERHFQKIHGRSIFTGLKSITHFGRPNFKLTLQTLKEIHPKARSIGVFTCGPNALIPTVEEAVRENNKDEGPLITHYYETFA